MVSTNFNNLFRQNRKWTTKNRTSRWESENGDKSLATDQLSRKPAQSNFPTFIKYNTCWWFRSALDGSCVARQSSLWCMFASIIIIFFFFNPLTACIVHDKSKHMYENVVFLYADTQKSSANLVTSQRRSVMQIFSSMLNSNFRCLTKKLLTDWKKMEGWRWDL